MGDRKPRIYTQEQVEQMSEVAGALVRRMLIRAGIVDVAYIVVITANAPEGGATQSLATNNTDLFPACEILENLTGNMRRDHPDWPVQSDEHKIHCRVPIEDTSQDEEE